MFDNRIKRTILYILVSGLFVGMNSFGVDARNELEQEEFIKIKESLRNLGKQLYKLDDRKIESMYDFFNQIDDMGYFQKNEQQKNINLQEKVDTKSIKENKKSGKDVNVTEKSEPTKAQRIAAITEFIEKFDYDKNYDKTQYMVEGFKVYPFRKDGVVFLYYIHENTNFQAIVPLEKQRFTSLQFSMSPENDEGEAHLMEHTLTSTIFEKLADKLGFVNPDMFKAQTDDYGFYYLILNEILDSDVLKWICQQLINPDFLNDKNFFNAEKKRVFHEIKNKEVSQKDAPLFLKYLNKYKNGGVSEEILKNTHEKMVELWKQYIRPNNALLILSVGDDPEKIKKFLKTIDEEFLQKAPNNEAVNIKSPLKATEQHVKVSKDSPVFKGVRDWNRNIREDIKYIGSVCFDVKNLSLEEKDALNLWANVLESLTGLPEKIKEKGYEFSCYDGSEILNEEIVINLYGKTGDKFSVPTLTSNVKNILKEVGRTFSTLDKDFSNGEEILVGSNQLINKTYIENGSFSSLDKYRKDYDLYKLFFFSKSKYKTPISDKIFKIRNGEMVDNKQEIEKNVRENVKTVLQTLADQPVKYVSVVEKSDKIKEKPKEDLLKLTNYRIKGCDGDNNLFRFIEYILRMKANRKVESLGLSYKGLLKAPYFNGNLMCIAHKQSKEDIDNYLNGDFKNEIREYDLKKAQFDLEKVSYKETLSREIKRAANLREILGTYYKIVTRCVQNNLVLSNKYSLFIKLKNKLQKLGVIFDTEEEFLNYRKKIKEFEEGFDYHYNHQENNKGGMEDKFLEFLINYINFNIKNVVTIHNNLVKLHNNVNSISYDAAKKAIDMNK